MQHKVANQTHQKISVGSQVSKLNHTELPRIQKDRNDIEDDIDRLTILAIRYEALDRELVNVTEEFDRAQDERKKRRLELNGIRDRVNSHLDEHQSYEVNFQEVEELCQMIDDKDKTLLNDLSKIRDLLN